MIRAFLLWFLASSAAHAEGDACDDPKCDTVVTSPFRSEAKRDYPSSFIDRPMILPPLMVQLGSTVGLTHVASFYGSIDDYGGALAFGADIGVTRRLQLGLYFALPFARPLLDTFVVDLQVGLNRFLNARIDVGVKQIDGFANYNYDPITLTGFLFGVGLPLRIKLGRYVALVSGSTSAEGFGPQPMAVLSGDGHHSYLGGSFIASTDVLAIFASPTFVLGALTLPVGIVIQPISRLRFGVRSGYRLGFTSDASGQTATTHAVPLGFDVALTTRSVDLGFAATILGTIDDQYTGNLGWIDAQQYDFHISGRF